MTCACCCFKTARNGPEPTLSVARLVITINTYEPQQHTLGTSCSVMCLSPCSCTRSIVSCRWLQSHCQLVVWYSQHTMLNLVRLCVLLLLLLLSTFISPMFFNTNHISNSTTSESVMEGWFKFTLDEIHQGVLGRKRKPVSRLSKWFDNNANKKNSLTPIDEIDHCCKHECFKLNHNLLQLQHLCNH